MRWQLRVEKDFKGRWVQITKIRKYAGDVEEGIVIEELEMDKCGRIRKGAHVGYHYIESNGIVAVRDREKKKWVVRDLNRSIYKELDNEDDVIDFFVQYKMDAV